MNTFFSTANDPLRPPGAGRRAFSLIEVMASVAMLTVIILGLVAMFGQTRKAFTVGLNQVDYLESGRAVADIMARDLEQITPSYVSNTPNFFLDTPLGYTVPLVQTNALDSFTNNISEFYFLTRYNQTWNGIGYKVVFSDVGRQIGALYRYYAPNIYISYTNNQTTPSGLDLRNQAGIFTNFYAMDPSATTNRIIDGVVNLRIRLFDPHGAPLMAGNIPYNTRVLTNTFSGEYVYGLFTSNALPAFVEVELGVLETRTFENYRAFTNNAAAAQEFLRKHAAQVHVFRQRIPLRNVDPLAYP